MLLLPRPITLAVICAWLLICWPSPVLPRLPRSAASIRNVERHKKACKTSFRETMFCTLFLTSGRKEDYCLVPSTPGVAPAARARLFLRQLGWSARFRFLASATSPTNVVFFFLFLLFEEFLFLLVSRRQIHIWDVDVIYCSIQQVWACNLFFLWLFLHGFSFDKLIGRRFFHYRMHDGFLMSILAREIILQLADLLCFMAWSGFCCLVFGCFHIVAGLWPTNYSTSSRDIKPEL